MTEYECLNHLSEESPWGRQEKILDIPHANNICGHVRLNRDIYFSVVCKI